MTTPGGITGQTHEYVTAHFTPREHASAGLAVFLLAAAALMIANSAGSVPAAFAVYSAGLTCGACGFAMIIGWNASGSNGRVCMRGAATAEAVSDEITRRVGEAEDRLAAQLNQITARLDTIADAEQETAGVLRDQLAAHRNRRLT